MNVTRRDSLKHDLPRWKRSADRAPKASRLRWLETVWQDARYGTRQLTRSPAFAVTAILVLALGIGVNTALFSIVNSLFFRDVNVPEPERLVYVNGRNEWGQLHGTLDPRLTEALRDTATDLADFTAHWNIKGRVAVGDTTTILPGTAGGLALAFLALRVSASAIKGLPTSDPMAFVFVPIALAAVVLAASVMSALRASWTDPAVVMRGE